MENTKYIRLSTAVVRNKCVIYPPLMYKWCMYGPKHVLINDCPPMLLVMFVTSAALPHSDWHPERERSDSAWRRPPSRWPSRWPPYCVRCSTLPRLTGRLHHLSQPSCRGLLPGLHIQPLWSRSHHRSRYDHFMLNKSKATCYYREQHRPSSGLCCCSIIIIATSLCLLLGVITFYAFKNRTIMNKNNIFINA